MRRFKQQLPENEVRQILAEATSGVLSIVDIHGIPYGVPLNFVYDGEHSIYFHCATEGRKMECIHHSGRASFCVIGLDDVVPEEFTTYFRSVIAGGCISLVEDESLKIEALQMLCRKYSPDYDSKCEIARGLSRVVILRFDIETMCGKESIELTRER